MGLYNEDNLMMPENWCVLVKIDRALIETNTRNQLRKTLLISLFVSIFLPNLIGQHLSDGRFFIRNFEPLDYDAESQNWDIDQDTDGNIYVANTGGFLFYDGVRWDKLKPDNDGVTLCLFQASDGRMYGAGTHFLGYFSNDENGFVNFISLDSLLPPNYDFGFIRSMVELKDKIYFQADRSIIIWDGQDLEIFETGLSFSHMILAESKILLATQHEGVYQFSDQDGDKSLTKLPWSEGLGFVRSVTTFGSKQLITTYHNGLFWMEEGSVRSVEGAVNEFLKTYNIHTTLKLTQDEIAFGTKKAGVLITDSQLNVKWKLNKETGLGDDDIKSLFLDQEKNLWIGNNRGISVLEYPIEFTKYDVVEEEIGTVEDIQEYGGNIYVGAMLGAFRLNPNQSHQTVSKHHQRSFTELPLSSIDNFAIKSLDVGLLFGGDEGLHLYDGKQAIRIGNKAPRKILPSKKHEKALFVGYYDGFDVLQLQESGTFEVEGIDLPYSEFRGIAETAQGDIWVTTVINGVIYVDLSEDLKVQSIQHFDINDGLPSDRDNLVYNVDDKIYFTTHKGIYVFDSLTHRFKPDSTFGDIYGNGTRFVYSFYYDGEDEVWLNAYDKRETGHAIKQPDGTWKLANDKFTAMNQMQMYDIYAQEDGAVWFGGSDALVRYEPSDERPERKAYYSKVRKVSLAGDSVIFGGNSIGNQVKTLDPESREMRFEVAALTYRNSAVIDYQYQLEGLDEQWSDWTSEAFKIYTNLPSGQFTFKVRAKNEFDEVSLEDSYAFSILPYFYETWWFRIILFAVFSTIAFYLTRFFSQRKLIKKVEELAAVRQVEKERDEAIIREKQKGIESIIKAQEEERQRIAKDLHDGIVQEIGSNIIRWRNLFSSSNQPSKEADQLIESLENSNAELRALSHQMMPKALSALGVIAAIEGLLDGSLRPVDIKSEFEHFGIVDRLPENLEITLYRVCQELVQNIVKHSRATQVNVQLFKAGSDINLIVEDDGVGFEENSNEEGIGLHNIKSRLEPLMGSIHFEPSPQKGTLVTVKIPLTDHV